MTHLEFAQAVSLIICAMSAGAICYGRLFITKIDKVYEKSRWLLFSMMALLALQYCIQLVFRIRATNYDAGALMNIMFFVPATVLMYYSMMTLLKRGRLSRYQDVFPISMTVVILGIALVGCIVYKGLILPRWLLYLLLALYFIGNLHLIAEQGREFKRARTTLDRDLGNPAGSFTNHLGISAYFLIILSVAVPFTLLDIRLLAGLGVILLPAFYILSISFICMGSRIQGVNEALESAAGKEEAEEEPIHNLNITEECISKIETVIEDWRARRGFADKELSLSSFAKATGIPQKAVTSYINSNLGCTFRSWITKIRIEEAKLLMKEKPNYCAEAIADECGFSSRSFFQTSFKSATGLTPREWLENQ